MVRQIPGEIAERLLEQAKHTGKAAKQAPKTIFKRAIGEKTDEEKKAEKEKEESGIEDVTGAQQQPALSQTDLRRRELKAEDEAKRKKLQKILHKRLFEEVEKVRRRKEEEERLQKMQEEEEKKKKKEKKIAVLEQKEKEEALAVKVAKRERGAGEFGPRKPK